MLTNLIIRGVQLEIFPKIDLLCKIMIKIKHNSSPPWDALEGWFVALEPITSTPISLPVPLPLEKLYG